jgi:hypothetical protein
LIVQWKSAWTTILVPIILALDFVNACKRGSPWECLLAEAIKKLAAVDPKNFPHPVLDVYVKGSSLYIITALVQKPGGMLKAVRYDHNFKAILRPFDKVSKRQFMKVFGDQSVVVTITVPRVHGQAGTRGVRPARRAAAPISRVSHGALRRALDAHLITKGMIKSMGLSE